jgi:hypothetical protein
MKKLAIALTLLSTPAFAQVHDRNYWSTFSNNCAKASELIRINDCEGVKGGCNCALKKTLELGCRIQYWGHVPYCPPQ